MKTIKEIKTGIIIGMSFLITVLIGGIIYAAVGSSWTSPDSLQVGVGSGLTMNSWNQMLANMNNLKTSVDSLTNNNTIYESSRIAVPTTIPLNSNYIFTHNFNQRAKKVVIWVAQNSDGSGRSVEENGPIYDTGNPSYTVSGIAVYQNNINTISIRVSETLGWIHDGTSPSWRQSGYIKLIAYK